MKTQCFTFLALFFVIFVFSQEKTIHYTIASDHYTLNGKPIDKNTVLQKNTDYKVLITDYNPFYYKINFNAKGKDNLKDFFEFIVKSTKIDVSSLPNITINMLEERNLTKDEEKIIEQFMDNYNLGYLLFEQLKTRLFNYQTINSLYTKIEIDNLLEYYLKNIIPILKNKTAEEQAKLGLPSQTNVEKIYLFLIELNDTLDVYKQNNNAFSLGSFNTKLNTSVSTTITLTPLDKDKEAIKSEKTINVKSAFNVSFSSGIITAWNAEKQYYSTKLTNGSYTIDVESERKIMPAVAALGNITLNSKNNLPEIGLCVGASVDIELTPNVLLGITFVPKNSNILISSGIGLSYQKKISDKYKLNTEYTEEPKLDAKKDIYQSGFWLGISYKIL